MTQQKKQRRERAAKRLVKQLEAGTKPEKIRKEATYIKGRNRYFTAVSAWVPLTDTDRARIHAELVALQN